MSSNDKFARTFGFRFPPGKATAPGPAGDAGGTEMSLIHEVSSDRNAISNSLRPGCSKQSRFLFESYNQRVLAGSGILGPFVQAINPSPTRTWCAVSTTNQATAGKAYRCLSGETFDVAVDLRRDSPTFCKWVGETSAPPTAICLDPFRVCSRVHGRCRKERMSL